MTDEEGEVMYQVEVSADQLAMIQAGLDLLKATFIVDPKVTHLEDYRGQIQDLKDHLEVQWDHPIGIR